MTRGFEQQDPGLNFCFPKPAPAAQHGCKPQAREDDARPAPKPRAVEPQPGP